MFVVVFVVVFAAEFVAVLVVVFLRFAFAVVVPAVCAAFLLLFLQ